MISRPPASRQIKGRVIETVGRRVLVRTEDGDKVCFLSGQRAVAGDHVHIVDAPGTGGKVVAVLPRTNQLRRSDIQGKEQVLASNLAGLILVTTPQQPKFQAELLDRYLVTASQENLQAIILLNKIDLGVPEEVQQELELRSALDIPIFKVSSHQNIGFEKFSSYLARSELPWVLVGHSGVGKTSLLSRLLPHETIGPIGEISSYWDAGKHTTTHTRIFSLPTGGELADSPGIRGFTPPKVDPLIVRDHFPGLLGIPCLYRDCLHRPNEDGCVAEQHLGPSILSSYRNLIEQASGIWRRSKYR